MRTDDTQETVREEYDRTASEYDSRWSEYIRATRRETVQRLPDATPKRVVDVGCGTGAMLAHLEQHRDIPSLVGVDLSRGMLAEANGNLSRAHLIQGSAGALQIGEDTADWVVSCNSFHFFPDPAQFLDEARRVLRPGGRLIVTDWCDDFLACQLCDWYLKITDPAHTRLFGEETLRRMVKSAGFQSVRADTYKIDWLWGLMTVTARIPTA